MWDNNTIKVMVVYGDEETGNIYGYRIQLPQKENKEGELCKNEDARPFGRASQSVDKPGNLGNL